MKPLQTLYTLRVRGKDENQRENEIDVSEGTFKNLALPVSDRCCKLCQFPQQDNYKRCNLACQ